MNLFIEMNSKCYQQYLIYYPFVINPQVYKICQQIINMKSKEWYMKRNNEIYDEYSKGDISYNDLGQKYNLSRDMIIKIVKKIRIEKMKRSNVPVQKALNFSLFVNSE